MKWVCEWCNQKFRRRSDTMVDVGHQKYCSPYCRRETKKERDRTVPFEYECKSCGSWVRGTRKTSTWKYCSLDCYSAKDEIYKGYHTAWNEWSYVLAKIEILRPGKMR